MIIGSLSIINSDCHEASCEAEIVLAVLKCTEMLSQVLTLTLHYQNQPRSSLYSFLLHHLVNVYSYKLNKTNTLLLLLLSHKYEAVNQG